MGAALGVLICLLPTAPASAPIADQIARLEGHTITVAANGASFTIDDVAGEGKPLVGVVERRGKELWLRTSSRQLRLTGPLARPRMAGPRYKVWVLGEVRGESLHARRLGILAAPGRFSSPARARTLR